MNIEQKIDQITNAEQPADARLPVSIRAYAPSYLGTAFLLVFFSLLSFYLGYNIAATATLIFALTAIPFFRFTDKIVFDGRRLIRTGIVPRVWFRMHGMRSWIKIRNVEQVDTIVFGSFRRGNRVYFSYRTTVFGNGPAIVFAGGGRRYRKMIRALLPRFETHVLDCKSYELSKYAAEPRMSRQNADRLKIPSADVLISSVFQKPKSVSSVVSPSGRTTEDTEDTELHRTEGSIDIVPMKGQQDLRLAANQLRFSGSLVRAVEAFRRALQIEPNNAWLLFEFSRCLHSIWHVDRDPKLASRAAAALRLAERRAAGDTELLERVGETYRQFGFSRRAASAYQKAVEVIGECFRALIGLAELALDDGKLAHVVHNFSAANRVAQNSALRRWTRSEADYFSRLSEDDEYMELEVSRLNLLDKLSRWKGTSFRIALYATPLIFAGALFNEPLVTDTGWLVSTAALITWAAMNIGFKMLSPRIPYDLVEHD